MPPAICSGVAFGQLPVALAGSAGSGRFYPAPFVLSNMDAFTGITVRSVSQDSQGIDAARKCAGVVRTAVIARRSGTTEGRRRTLP